MSSNLKGVEDLARRVGVDISRSVRGLSAGEILKTIQRPSRDPYWKLRREGACQDIFFMTTFAKIQDQIKCVSDLAVKYHYPLADLGIYIQPVVQGVNCHC